MSEYKYPVEPYAGNPNISPAQFGVLNEVQPGHVVSFRHPGMKTFGKKQVVTGVERNEHHLAIDHLPEKDTRTTNDKRYVTNEHAWTDRNGRGVVYRTNFYVHNPNEPSPEIKIHRK